MERYKFDFIGPSKMEANRRVGKNYVRTFILNYLDVFIFVFKLTFCYLVHLKSILKSSIKTNS